LKCERTLSALGYQPTHLVAKRCC